MISDRGFEETNSSLGTLFVNSLERCFIKYVYEIPNRLQNTVEQPLSLLASTCHHDSVHFRVVHTLLDVLINLNVPISENRDRHVHPINWGTHGHCLQSSLEDSLDSSDLIPISQTCIWTFLLSQSTMNC